MQHQPSTEKAPLSHLFRMQGWPRGRQQTTTKSCDTHDWSHGHVWSQSTTSGTSFPLPPTIFRSLMKAQLKNIGSFPLQTREVKRGVHKTKNSIVKSLPSRDLYRPHQRCQFIDLTGRQVTLSLRVLKLGRGQEVHFCRLHTP